MKSTYNFQFFVIFTNLPWEKLKLLKFDGFAQRPLSQRPPFINPTPTHAHPRGPSNWYSWFTLFWTLLTFGFYCKKFTQYISISYEDLRLWDISWWAWYYILFEVPCPKLSIAMSPCLYASKWCRLTWVKLVRFAKLKWRKFFSFSISQQLFVSHLDREGFSKNTIQEAFLRLSENIGIFFRSLYKKKECPNFLSV